MNSPFRLTLCTTFFSIAAAASLAQPARAVTDGIPSRTVSYADLDLSKPAGAQVLYRRIATAARHVCAINGVKDLDVPQRERTCTEGAISAAVKQVNSAALSELHQGRAPRLASN